MGSEEGKEPFISVIIPVRNGRKTIATCLEATFASRYQRFEVIVVDDRSDDGTAEIVRRFPARLILLPRRSGAARARNAGAEIAKGDALFFIDADCVPCEDTIQAAARAFREEAGAAVGGTYTPLSYDRGFFSDFQSIFIHYSETKEPEPDYVATHAMLIGRGIFQDAGGFDVDFLPMLEDVEFSHRLRDKGIRLVMQQGLNVRHIFNFSLAGSLRNAFRKSMYWTIYSLRNRDLFKDSGTASLELKVDTVAWGISISLLLLYAVSGNSALVASVLAVCALNLSINRKFIKALFRAKGLVFTLQALFYYTALYPAAVGTGGLVGVMRKK